MITGTGALAVPGTKDLTHFALVAINNLFGAVDRYLLASANLGELWCRVAACRTPACRTLGGYTTLETSGTRTLIAHSAAAALRSPAAVTTVATSRFGAALDVVGKAGAAVGDKSSAFGSAFLGGYAHSRSRPLARALAVQGRSFSKDMGADSAKPEESGSEEDGEVMHPAW